MRQDFIKLCWLCVGIGVLISISNGISRAATSLERIGDAIAVCGERVAE